MDKKNISFLLSLYLAVFLTLLAAGFLFAFIINWEDWFFGIKLDGLPAGIYLFSKAVVAALLAYLLLKYGTKQFLLSIASLFFFLFASSCRFSPASGISGPDLAGQYSGSSLSS